MSKHIHAHHHCHCNHHHHYRHHDVSHQWPALQLEKVSSSNILLMTVSVIGLSQHRCHRSVRTCWYSLTRIHSSLSSLSSFLSLLSSLSIIKIGTFNQDLQSLLSRVFANKLIRKMPLLGSQEHFKYSILSWVQSTLLRQQYKSVKFSIKQMESMAHNTINLIHKLYPRVRNLHCSMKGQRIYHEERIVDCVIGNLKGILFQISWMGGCY